MSKNQPRARPGALPVDPDVGPGDRLRGWSRTRHYARRVRRVVVRRRAILAVISAGGGLGSMARWALGAWWAHSPGEFPWSTYAINVVGSFLLAVLIVLVTEVWPRSTYIRPFLGVGVLGGFTTFSTYMLDVHELILDGRALRAGLYLAASLLSGLVSAWIGLVVTRPVAERIVAAGTGREEDEEIAPDSVTPSVQRVPR